MESIHYASGIQYCVLPSYDIIKESLSDFFIIWQPRDNVGGDIYWFEKWGSGWLLSIADCTGHGVPGAFITLLAKGALDLALLAVDEGNTAKLIATTHQVISAKLVNNKKDDFSDAGLDIGVCYIPPHKKTLHYCGAKFSLFLHDGKEIIEIKGDKKAIGYRDTPYNTAFTSHTINIADNMRFYMTSDGLMDQIGGEKKRSFGKKRFTTLLSQIW
ncbi:Stage II sporulation protein E (SpoIIE) [Candidatus Magnetoovum chiemensis]|nr:Stage II sporulation protein E (SpoIIE) [Candidatus Magnetoovum chiemensis]